MLRSMKVQSAIPSPIAVCSDILKDTKKQRLQLSITMLFTHHEMSGKTSTPAKTTPSSSSIIPPPLVVIAENLVED